MTDDGETKKGGWRDDPKWQDIFESGTLPEICLALRSSLNGSSDPWTEEEEQFAVDYLTIRLNEWKDVDDFSTVFSLYSFRMDEYVKGMCSCVLNLREEKRKSR